MSKHYWFDAEHEFKINLELMGELEKTRDAGAGMIFSRIVSNNFFVADLQNLLRLALIGGGTSPSRAAELVQLGMAHEGLIKAQLIAVGIIESVLTGTGETDERTSVATDDADEVEPVSS